MRVAWPVFWVTLLSLGSTHDGWSPWGGLFLVRRWQSLAVGSPHPVLLLGAPWKVEAIAAPTPSSWQLSLRALWAVATSVGDLG